MGAIAVFHSSRHKPSVTVVQRMASAAPHRGSRTETLVHGHSALAVTNSDEPHDARLGVFEGHAVAVVGSLASTARLAEELASSREARGEPPIPFEDLPALLAAGFRAFGDQLPVRLRGIFAVAITDGNRVFAFRDHIGYRSLFYRLDARGLYAATEAKQVVAGAEISSEPDFAVLAQIYFRTTTDETPAALKGVRRLPKATSIWFANGDNRLYRYWQPESLLETARYSGEELRDRFDTLMDQAVARCLTGHDVISLSGGIDSPAIAAYAAGRHLELSGKPLQAMSVIYPQYPSVDESRYVEPLARHLGLPLHAYEQTAKPLAGMARWARLADTPFPGAALSHYEEDFLRARALGFRSILTGEHAEFVFAFQWQTLDHYLTHGRLRAARRELTQRRARGQSWVSLARLIGRSIASDRVMRARHRLDRKRPPTIPAWIDLRRATEEDPLPARERWKRSQLAGFIGPGVALEAEEVCQAVCGVTVRRPWTDIDLWEFFLSLQAEQKFPDLRPKGLVRDLLRGRVPDQILDRTDKTVFDEAMLADIDYATLRQFLTRPEHRIDGVDYEVLGRLLELEHLAPVDYQWARNLASVHAFLTQWSA